MRRSRANPCRTLTRVVHPTTSTPRGARRGHHPASPELRRLPPLLLATAHQHAHRPVPAAARRVRGRARLARSPADLRPERRHPVQGRQPRMVESSRLPRGLQHLFVGVVLSHLHPPFHLAHRLHHPAHDAPRQGASNPSPRKPRPDSTGCPASCAPPPSSGATMTSPGAFRRQGTCCGQAATGFESSTGSPPAPSGATCARPATSSSTSRWSASCSLSDSAEASSGPARRSCRSASHSPTRSATTTR
jgi:hypothetical protein